MSELLSIITRTHGSRTRLLQRAATSILSQTYKPIEWLVVEDGTDQAGPTLSNLPEQDGLVIRRLVIPKRGRSAAANSGLNSIRGAYASFLDDDDELYANHGATLVQLLRRHPNAAGAYAASVQSQIKGYSSDGTPLVTKESVFLVPSLNSTPLLWQNLFPIQAVVFRTNRLGRYRFDEKLDALEDWLFWMQVFLERPLVWTPELTSRFFIPADEADNKMRLESHSEAMSYFNIQRQALLDERRLGDLRFLQGQYMLRLLSSAQSIRQPRNREHPAKGVV
jgi:glycosyltransferase involved in cell wall biosynthesis